METVAHLAGAVPQDHGASALLWVVVLILVGLLVWIVQFGMKSIVPAIDRQTEAIKNAPPAIGAAVKVAVHDALREAALDKVGR